MDEKANGSLPFLTCFIMGSKNAAELTAPELSQFSEHFSSPVMLFRNTSPPCERSLSFLDNKMLRMDAVCPKLYIP